MSLNVTSNIGVIGYNNTNTSKNGFVAVAGTSEYSAYSTDGINWTDFKISDSFTRDWSSISYGNGIYVAFPSTSKYYAYSYDGINWTETQFTNVSITGKVCFGNGKFVVCSASSNGASNTVAIYSSTDGINWTTATDISQLSYDFLEEYTGVFTDGDVTRLYPCYGNGKFVAVTDNYSLSVYSTDGLTWTRVSIIDYPNIKFRAICYGNDKFVAVAYNTNYFAYSSDGITWTTGRLPSSGNWYSVCYGNGKFVTIAYSSNAFAYSTNGINWTAGTISSTSRRWESVCYGDGKFIAIASGTNYFAYSTDGITWTESTISSTSRSWDSVCFGVINASINTPEKAFNLSQPENASTTEFEDKVILDSIVHHDSPMYLLINQKATDNNFYIHSPILGDLTLTGSNRKTYPVDSNMNRNCIGGKLHPLGNGYVAYSVYSNNMDATSKFNDSNTGSLELITGIIKVNPYLGYYKSVNGQGFYGSENDKDEFMESYRKVNDTNYNIEFSNNHTGISSDVTDVNGISSMTTYTEQYTEDVHYIHYAWVDRASSSLVRYNILTRKIDTSSGTPIISNVTSCTTTFSIGTIAHPSFHKDKNGIHCAFYHGNTTYTKYYKLTRSGTDDSTWSWSVDSNTYITNENISLMVNKNENNLQSSLAQSARRMYMVNSSDNLVEFKKTQTF